MIRLLTPADAAAFAELRRAMLLDAPFAFGSSPGVDRASDAGYVAERLASPDQAAAGAFDGGRLVSTGILVRDSAAKRRHIASIYSVYTAPGARRRGLGRGVCALLLEAAGAWSGVEVVQLSVSEAASGARAMYESLGFEAWGFEPDALRVGGASYGEVHMFVRLGVSGGPGAAQS